MTTETGYVVKFFLNYPGALLHKCPECHAWFEISWHRDPPAVAKCRPPQRGYVIKMPLKDAEGTVLTPLDITPEIECPRCPAVYSVMDGKYTRIYRQEVANA